MIESLPIGSRFSIKFFDRWISRSKSHWELWILRSHGASGDADTHSVEETLPTPKEKFRRFDLRDIYIADECGFNYCMPPDKMVEHMPLPGRKNSNERVSLLFCINFNGSDKL